MSDHREYLAGSDTPELRLFRENFNTYRQSLDKKEVDALMKKHPGEEWRIILIKQSGIELPPSIIEFVRQYEERKKIEDERVNKIKLFLNSEEAKKIGNMYIKFKNWHQETYHMEPDITMIKFKEIVSQI